MGLEPNKKTNRILELVCIVNRWGVFESYNKVIRVSVAEKIRRIQAETAMDPSAVANNPELLQFIKVSLRFPFAEN